MEIKINVDKLGREELVQILAIVAEQKNIVKEKAAEEKPLLPKIREGIGLLPVPLSSKKKKRHHKLFSVDEVVEILNMRAAGKTERQIGDKLDRYGNSIQSLLWRIDHNENTSKVTRKAVARFKKLGKAEVNPKKKPFEFTKTEIDTIWKEHKNNNTHERIAALVHRDVKAVKSIIYRMGNPKYRTEAMKKVFNGDV